jgi:uncharacterized protein YbjT (DUF2867 family)
VKILVLGGTGPTGRHVIDEALDAGHEVTALVRNAAKLQPRDRLTVVTGSPANAAELEAALAGKDALISVLGPSSNKADPICADAAVAAVAAMKKLGVRRVVWLSASGVGDSRQAMNRTSFVFGRIILPLFLSKPYANHERAENTLRESGLDWTIVRPVLLVDASTGQPATAYEGDGPVPRVKIARNDVARWLIAQLGSGDYVRKLPLLYA